MADALAQQAAFVLHARPYRETSLLVDLLTLNEGRVPVVARGARRPGSQLRHSLQPFSLLSVRYRGKDELKTLISAEVAQYSGHLSGKSLLCGLYANELLERLLLPLVAAPELFLYYQYLLNELVKAEDLEIALRTFEQQLLRELGAWCYPPQKPAQAYRFISGEGMVGCDPSLPDAIPHDPLVQINQGRYEQPDVRRYAKRLMRTILADRLGDKPLRSRALFEKRIKPHTTRSLESE